MEAALRESRSSGINWDGIPVVLSRKHDDRLLGLKCLVFPFVLVCW